MACKPTDMARKPALRVSQVACLPFPQLAVVVHNGEWGIEHGEEATIKLL
jgi:hypothetical protein